MDIQCARPSLDKEEKRVISYRKPYLEPFSGVRARPVSMPTTGTSVLGVR